MAGIAICSTLSARQALEAILALSRSVEGIEAHAHYVAGSSLDSGATALQADVFIGPVRLTQSLTHGGVLAEADTSPLFDSTTALAVLASSPIHELRTGRELKALLLSASRICCSAAESGRRFRDIAARLEILQAIEGRCVTPPPGGLVAEVLDAGLADVGFQQRSELMGFQSLRIVDLPAGYSSSIRYCAAVFAGSTKRDESLRWISHLRSPPLRSVWSEAGLDPVTD